MLAGSEVIIEARLVFPCNDRMGWIEVFVFISLTFVGSRSGCRFTGG
jgi:hypothetical protein